jgi:hypothetical protein
VFRTTIKSGYFEFRTMVSGFLSTGVLLVLAQLAVVAGLYGYLRFRRPVADATAKRRTSALVAGGSGVVAVAQLAAVVLYGVAVGSVRLPFGLGLSLPFDVLVLVPNGAALATLVGYLGVAAGFVVYSRAVD